jgi:hypothetical protein
MSAAPTRRGALQFSAAALFAGLTVPAIAGHADGDAELIRLGHEMDTAVARQAEAWATVGREDTDEAESIAVAAQRHVGTIVDQIEALPATTLDGLKVKRRAIAWCWCDEPVTAEMLADHPQPAADMRILAGLLQDLSAMMGAGA